MKLPELTQQPILHVNCTPNEDYPLRILRAYRQQCDCKWVENTDPSDEPTNPLLIMMNEHCDQRAEILNRAIEKLSKKE